MPLRITVVTPSYNQAKYLEETLCSVLSQRDQIDEYFVLDGGSTDGSADLIARYAEKGGIDYWHSTKDKGQSHAIAQGFARSTGDYIAWLNSDDVFLPGALAKIRAALEGNPQWEVMSGYHVRIDGDSRIMSMHRIPRESPTWARWGVVHVAQQTCFFRRSLYENVGGLDLSLHAVMDTELWLRMFQSEARWGHIPEYLAAFRVHETSKGQAWLKEYAAEGAMLNGKYPAYMSWRRHIGLPFYRATQIVSGRHLRAGAESKRNRGKKLTDVFGDWKMPAAPAMARGANA